MRLMQTVWHEALCLFQCTDTIYLSKNPPIGISSALYHSGNILVRLVDPNTTWGRIATFLKVNTAPKLVLLDVGMVAELTPEDQQNLVGFFKVRASSQPLLVDSVAQ